MVVTSHDQTLTAYFNLKMTCSIKLHIQPTQLTIYKSGSSYYILVVYLAHLETYTFYCSQLSSQILQISGMPITGQPFYERQVLYTVIEDDGKHFILTTSNAVGKFNKAELPSCDYFIIRYDFRIFVECQNVNMSSFFDLNGFRISSDTKLPSPIKAGDTTVTITKTDFTLTDKFKTTTYAHSIDIIRYDGSVFEDKLTLFIISRNCIASKLCSSLLFIRLDTMQIEHQDQSFSGVFFSEYLSVKTPHSGWSLITKLIISFLLGSNLLVVLFWLWTRKTR